MPFGFSLPLNRLGPNGSGSLSEEGDYRRFAATRADLVSDQMPYVVSRISVCVKRAPAFGLCAATS
jgi:hypothetical protein